MKPLSRPTTRLIKRVLIILFRASKDIYQRFRFGSSHQKTIVYIIGCQRSGTTLLRRIFELDSTSKGYGEQSKLTSNDVQKKIRLNPLGSVKKVIDNDSAYLIILKPLVETQNSLKLLDYFENSKALWLYRHYKDVALSNLTRFGVENGINNLRPIFDGKPHHWKSENVPENVRKIVLEHFSEAMNPNDAAALFWFVRNSFFFELKFDRNPNVIILKYENFVTNPIRNMKNIYSLIGHNYPGDRIVIGVHSASVGKGKSIELSPEIDLLCKKLLEKLDKVYQTRDYYVE